MIATDGALPRRYCLDAKGHRVIIGLSPEETSEFEGLDSTFGAENQTPGQASDGAAAHTISRLLELYEKHNLAWKHWLAGSKNSNTDSGFVNQF